ncbi:synapse-associated protein 1-like isoform X2 [Littorina saxatilis]|uniref:synapse-associated protein 1-like isoform X2 n=1 Tax=Littorina saxatilis TaxID=31220 RepID=UPI0038B4B19C
MFSSVTNWLGVNIKGKDAEPSDENKENQGEATQPHSESRESISSTSVETSTSSKSLPESDSEECKSTSEEESSQDSSALHTLEDVSSKAINTAKEFGSILFNFGKAAGKTVAEQANKLKTTVEEKTILGDFNKEHEKFLTEKKEHKKQEDAAVPPWVGYNEEEAMKNQILALSSDRRNFLRNPPSGVKYQFDFNQAYPIALATLQEDPNLQKMRFELVPKKTTEENFWRNYFYRVSLIKQSTQLTSLTQQAGDNRSSSSSRRSSDSSSTEQKEEEEEDTAKDSSVQEAGSKEESEVPDSPTQDEFVSDTFSQQQLTEEEVRREMEQLGVKDDQKQEEVADWEKELQQELQDYEMVGGAGDVDDEDLEREILQQIEQETKDLS